MMGAVIRGGFYRSHEVVPILPNLLALLDGRDDIVGVQGEEPGDRYRQWTTVQCNSVTIMECKLWLCRILQERDAPSSITCA